MNPALKRDAKVMIEALEGEERTQSDGLALLIRLQLALIEAVEALPDRIGKGD